jgi:hypothetical protein
LRRRYYTRGSLGQLDRHNPTLNNLDAIAYGNGQYVVVGVDGFEWNTGDVLTSRDGVHWVHRQLGAPNGGTSVAYGQGRFVVAGSLHTAWTSADGTNWIIGHDFVGYQIGYANGQFLTSSWEGILMSTDGSNWVRRLVSLDCGTDFYFGGIAYGNGQFVAVGFAGGSETCPHPVIVSSSDGVNWVQRSAGTTNSSLGRVAFGNGRFVAIGETFQGGTFVATLVVTSADGVNWVSTEFPNLKYLSSIAFGSGLFVAVGPTIMSSTDGLNWSSRVPWDPRSVGFINGRFIAVGRYGTILESDPIVKLMLTPHSEGALSLSLEGPIGLDYTIQSSADLISWKDVTKITNTPSSRVTFQGLPATPGQRYYRASSP